MNTPNTPNTPNTLNKPNTDDTTIKDMVKVTNDEITLGNIIEAIIKMSNELPSEGTGMIKMIQDAVKKYDLPLNFITKTEQDKLKVIDTQGVDEAKPIKLGSLDSLAQQFITLQERLEGDPGIPTDQGLVGEFAILKAKGNEWENFKNTPAFGSQELTLNEKTVISVLGNNLLTEQANGSYIFDFTKFQMDFIPALKAAGCCSGGSGSGTGIAPADQEKLNHLTITSDVDVDAVQTLINGIKSKTDTLDATVLANIALLTPEVIADALGSVQVDGSKKFTEEITVGDRSASAQVTLDSKAGTSSHVVFKREGVPKCSLGLVGGASEEFILEQRTNNDIKFILPTGQSVTAKFGHEWVKFQTTRNGDTRPTDKENGEMFFDNHLGMPIWWNEKGKKWVKADGTDA